MDDAVTHTDANIIRAKNVLAALQRENISYFECTVHMPKNSLEYVTTMARSGQLRMRAADIFGYRVIRATEREYAEGMKHDREMIDISTRENWFYQSTYYDKAILFDARQSHDPNTPGNGFVELLDRYAPYREADAFSQYITNTKELASLLVSGEFDMANERIKFLREVYSTPEAVRVVMEHATPHQVFEALFTAEEAFQHVDAALGRDEALNYLNRNYEQRQVWNIINEVLPAEECFAAWDMLYATHVPAEESPAAAPSTYGGMPTSAAVMQKAR